MSMESSTQGFVKAASYFLLAAVGIVCLPWLSGYVLSQLWGWFIVPTLNAPPLSTWPAAGVYWTAAFLTKQHHEEKSDLPAHTRLLAALLKPLVALAVGWLIHALVLS